MKKEKPIKIRKDWGNINPRTQIKGSDKVYQRHKEKNIQNYIDDTDIFLDNSDIDNYL